MLIKNSAILKVDKVLTEIQEKIKLLEEKENLTEEQKNKLKKLKLSYDTKAYFRFDEMMGKEVKNPVDILITNSIHFAVALNLESDTRICIAKGVDQNALIMMRTALHYNVKVVEYKELAIDIYETAELYKPVENHIIYSLDESQKNISLFDAIEIAIKSKKLVNMEYVLKAIEEKNMER